MEEKKNGTGFVVKDKRFSGDSEEMKKDDEIKNNVKDEKQETAEQPDQKQEEGFKYPPVNFTNFVLSLSTSALFHFGDFPDDEGGQPQKNLAAAKQTIDILDMLNEKTKGNLDKNESDLIQGVLYELKMRYVKEKV
jgi:hypothetical protein